jgi:hypothetical protein
MTLQENEINLINRAVDRELTESQRTLFEKLVAGNSEAMALFAELSAMVNQISQLSRPDPPWDIASEVKAKLLSRKTSPQMSNAQKMGWAMAASFVFAVGILNLDINTGTEGDLVGTIAQPENMLAPLVYLAQDQDWVVAINISRATEFRLLLGGLDEKWQLKAAAGSGLEIARVGSQLEIKGRGPVSINLPLVANRPIKSGSSPELEAELALDGKIYQGHLALKKN